MIRNAWVDGRPSAVKAIKFIKDFFQENPAKALNLRRVTAPLFVKAGTGVNDDLNGVEKPVSFRINSIGNAEAQIVQTLAKWKRLMLADLNIKHGEGLYTGMNAIRPNVCSCGSTVGCYGGNWPFRSAAESASPGSAPSFCTRPISERSNPASGPTR